MYSKGGTLLTSAVEVMGQQREHLEELLNPTNPPSRIEVERKDDGDQHQFPWREVTEVV